MESSIVLCPARLSLAHGSLFFFQGSWRLSPPAVWVALTAIILTVLRSLLGFTAGKTVALVNLAIMLPLSVRQRQSAPLSKPGYGLPANQRHARLAGRGQG